MGSEWKVVQLGELGSFKNGANYNRGDYGDKYPIASVKNLFRGRFVTTDDLDAIKDGVIKRIDDYLLKKGDILIARSSVKRSGAGQVAIVNNHPENCIFSGFTIRFRPKDESVVSPLFLLYLFRSPQYREEFTRIATGTTIHNLSQATLASINISLPDIEYQKRITHILGSLDDKIELNHQMNVTLESMAQALFKNWFVDFDPVIDNALAAGNPIPEPLHARAETRKALGDKRKPLPEAIQKQFPSRFVFSEEMGWLPDGWAVGKFGDIAKHIKDNVKAEDVAAYDFYVGLEHIGRKQILLTENGSGESIGSNKSGFIERDLLFGKLRPYFHKVCIAPRQGICSTDILVFRPKRQAVQSYMTLTAYADVFVEYANIRSTGTRMPRASAKDILEYLIPIPSESILGSFESMVAPIWKKGMTAIEGNRSLINIRDTLLPKLLSGKLRVPDAEKLIA